MHNIGPIVCFLFVPLACSCNSNQNGSEEKGQPSFTLSSDETYGQAPNNFQDVDTDALLPRRNYTQASETIKDNTQVELFFPDENITKQFNFESFSFALRRLPDDSVTLMASIFGELESGVTPDGDSWTTYCGVNFRVPWQPESPPELPYTWHYKDNENPFKNLAEKESRNSTIVGMYKETYLANGGPEPKIQLIIPSRTDPSVCKSLVGEMVITKTKNIDWDAKMAFTGHGDITCTDYSGLVVQAKLLINDVALEAIQP